MSNSIWKTPDQKPDTDKKEFSSFPRQVVACHISSYGIEWGVAPVSLYNPTVKIEKWCYLDDLITQVDKAERLEKENEAMRQEFEVWHGNHKCVVEDKERLQKVAEALKEFITKLYLNGSITDEQLERYKNTLKRIENARHNNVRK